MRISAQQRGLAGVPGWLRVGQFNSSFGPAYMYGTPTEPEGTIPLEIRGLNEITFESRTREVTITIFPADGECRCMIIDAPRHLLFHFVFKNHFFTQFRLNTMDYYNIDRHMHGIFLKIKMCGLIVPFYRASSKLSEN